MATGLRPFTVAAQGLHQSHIAKQSRSTTWKFERAFSSCVRLNITGEEAPSSRSYIESGVIAGARNLVDVKKVLVIGSGGLSIGQAGEFDYSGELSSFTALNS
jgi:carbamoyl-phosphate synthase large subunit